VQFGLDQGSHGAVRVERGRSRVKVTQVQAGASVLEHVPLLPLMHLVMSSPCPPPCTSAMAAAAAVCKAAHSAALHIDCVCFVLHRFH